VNDHIAYGGKWRCHGSATENAGRIFKALAGNSVAGVQPSQKFPSEMDGRKGQPEENPNPTTMDLEGPDAVQSAAGGRSITCEGLPSQAMSSPVLRSIASAFFVNRLVSVDPMLGAGLPAIGAT
jgi:hypothetical protein